MKRPAYLDSEPTQCLYPERHRNSTNAGYEMPSPTLYEWSRE